jgi:hypothetical protein
MKNSRLMLLSILLLCCVTVVPLLSAQDVRPQVPEVPGELVKLFFKDLCPAEGAYKCTDEDMALWKSRFEYKLHDLNGDNVPEYFLSIEHHDWCGAGSNCDNTVYMKTARGYKMLASDKVLKVLETRTNGYLDIESHFTMGACGLPDGESGWEFVVTSYKFNGKKYKASTQTERRCLRQSQ